MTWVILGVALLVVSAGIWRLFRSLRRWSLPDPSSEEGKQAEARLWSVRNMNQR